MLHLKQLDLHVLHLQTNKSTYTYIPAQKYSVADQVTKFISRLLLWLYSVAVNDSSPSPRKSSQQSVKYTS